MLRRFAAMEVEVKDLLFLPDKEIPVDRHYPQVAEKQHDSPQRPFVIGNHASVDQVDNVVSEAKQAPRRLE
jgi:hypothetical protein